MKKWILLLTLSVCGFAVQTGNPIALETVLREGFQYRNLGPFRVGGWVSDIAVPATPAKAHLYTFYVAARHGGVFKTTNNGTTFEPVFDNQNVAAVGALAVAPTNENIVWVGTGDNSCARSAYWGDGIYKSTDAGKTWQNMGLKDSHHITRIVTHPTNADIVYVAAMGHLYTTNEERGVFKTTDGGKTWQKVLYVNDRTGAIDLALSRNEPNTLYAAAYDLKRDPWRIVDGGAGSGIYKTTDGGASWKKLENGLPTGTIGRIGIDLYQKNPNILYAVVDNRNLRPAATQGPQQIISGEVYRTDDAGTTWRKVSADKDDVSRKSGYAFNILRVHPENPERVFITGSNLIESTDGGKTWIGLSNFGGGPPQEGRQQPYRPFRRAFGDFRVLWIDPQNPERMMAGSDGGVYVSYDGAKTCDHLNNLPLGEVYALTVDMAEPYNIYAGLQDHESWRGPSNGWSGSIGLEDWTTTGIGDGMYNQVDPTDNRWVYNTQEFSRAARFDQKTRERKEIAPARSPDNPLLRFNWVAPLRLSPHDPKTVYVGAQVLFRSTDRGDTWQEISPDLTTNDPSKISPPGAAIQHCTITTISESPKQAGVIWVGTDDGKVQVTKDAGANWFDATRAIAQVGGPEDAWTNRVFASHYQAGTAYVAKSRHRQDDFRAFLFKTTDYGATWTTIHHNLPARPINVIWEDNVNPELLFVGNDMGVYVSLDGGKAWAALKGNLPLVAVHDLIVHPREGDLVVGTYGRGIWVTDITPLREMQKALQAEAYLFAIEPKARRREGALGNYRLYGDRLAVTPNEPNGLTFVYYLKEAAQEKVTLTVADASGKTLRTLDGATKAGLNRVILPLLDFGQQFGGGGSGRGPNVAPLGPGDYTVTLQAGGKQFTQTARVPATPQSN